MGRLISEKYAAWQAECEERFQQLKKNEEELNRIFIDIYGLQDELTPDVADKDVTVHRVFDSKDDVPESMKGSNYVRTMRDEIVSLISYAVGCMFGRYSLDVDGLVYAGGDFDSTFRKGSLVDESGTAITFGGIRIAVSDTYDYIKNEDKWIPVTFAPDTDNIIPICDDEYFDDDITGRFVEFVRKACSWDHRHSSSAGDAPAEWRCGACPPALSERRCPDNHWHMDSRHCPRCGCAGACR